MCSKDRWCFGTSEQEILIKIPINVGWFDIKDFNKILAKNMVILRASDQYLKGHCDPSSGTTGVGVVSRSQRVGRDEVPQPHCAMSGTDGLGFTGTKFFRAFLRLVPSLQLFWQTREAVS